MSKFEKKKAVAKFTNTQITLDYFFWNRTGSFDNTIIVLFNDHTSGCMLKSTITEIYSCETVYKLIIIYISRSKRGTEQDKMILVRY